MVVFEDVLMYSAFIALIASFFLQRFLVKKQLRTPSYQQEVLEILNKEEYKVKGRFE